MFSILSRIQRSNSRGWESATRRGLTVCPRLESLEERCVLSSLSPPLVDNPHDVTVMSRNLYLGGDLNPVVAAVQTGDPMSIATAVGELWRDVHTRDFTARAEALAEEIAQQQPVFIGLQEVSQFTDRDVILARSDLPAPAVVMTGSTVERVAIFCSVAAVMTGCLVAQAAISSTVDGETTHLPVAKAMTGCSEAWATTCWTAAADSTGCLAASDSTSC